MIDCHFDPKDGIYELVLNRAPCNEIGSAMLLALEEVLETIDPNKGKALILRSGSAKGFCAGADLRELYEGVLAHPDGGHEAKLREFLDRIHSVMDRLDTLAMPTIGVVHGVCFGGGFELALTCDILIAEKTARFCFPELRLGIIPGFGGIPRLKRDVGNALVRDLLLTGRSINAKKAVQVGLVSQMVAVGEGPNVARAMARQTAHFDGDAMRTCKSFIKPLPTEELKQEKEHFLRLFKNPAVKAALKTFYESDDVRPYL
ncbi:MAG: enoyl-CoA hydratase/isomerase family protein [Planctomycetota bacterium]|nr:enoyl-CoA hydratase/isomerase family protein [Planctomycetota bacterium]